MRAVCGVELFSIGNLMSLFRHNGKPPTMSCPQMAPAELTSLVQGLSRALINQMAHKWLHRCFCELICLVSYNGNETNRLLIKGKIETSSHRKAATWQFFRKSTFTHDCDICSRMCGCIKTIWNLKINRNKKTWLQLQLNKYLARPCVNKEWQQSPRAWGLGGAMGALQMVAPVTLELTVSFFTVLRQNDEHLPGALLLFDVNKTEELAASQKNKPHSLSFPVS